MAREVRSYAATIPAGTASSSPAIIDFDMPARIVREIDILVPPGPRGQMGFAISSGGFPVVPINEGAWIITDDDKIAWPLQTPVDSGAWQLMGYNTGTYDHTVYVTFQLDPTTAADAAPYPQPVASGG